MDIWGWVYDAQVSLRKNGHDRLAQIVDELPPLVVEGNHEQAEAIVPEGLALARQLDHPWLEVFLRHWLAQSRILHRHDVTRGMDEVIRLLDFAHEERTRDCPQSVCVVQDVCSAYGALDGPGYMRERLAVSSEAMARIDSSWSCFECIGTEHAEALIDGGRFEEAERFCRDLIARSSGVWALRRDLADALSHQGRHAEAFEVLEREPPDADSRHHGLPLRLHRSRELALLGRVDEALELKVDASEVDAGDYVLWARATQALVDRAAVPNDATLGLTFRKFFCTLRDNGALFNQATLASMAGALAIRRGRRSMAILWIDTLESLVPKLRAPQRIADSLQQLRAALEALPDGERCSAPEALERLGQDAEANLDILAAAAGPSADSESAFALARCDALSAVGFSDRAQQELQNFVARSPQSVEALDRLLRLLVVNADFAQFEALVQSRQGDAQLPRILFYQSRLMQKVGRWEEAAAALEQARAIDPGVTTTRSNLAVAYRHLKRLDRAMELLDALVIDQEPGDDDWERMVVGTWLEQFDKVRDSARRLGFKFTGEGRIDEPCGYCDIRFKEADGRERTCRAERTSPVTARIVEMARPGEASVFHDEWLFDATPLNPRPPAADSADEAAAIPHTYVFRSLKLLTRGEFRTYDLDGIHPGAEAIDELRGILAELGVFLSVRSSDEYLVTPPQSSEPELGLYAYVVVPASIQTSAIYDVIAAHVAKWRQPVTYRGLLRELDLKDALERHERWAEEMQL